ncbi:TIGR00730 family Rossman fold protein [Candidatus Gottesmanbacteria bacterium]|nr:TIGR00730 family Rossman fold protein [Candidatus Gottesmanbacteria bacterium]
MRNIVVFAANEVKKERENYYYTMAYKMGKLLAQNGFVTVTGGGPGLMNEVMRGAFENGGKTIGVRLQIPGRVHSTYATQHLLFDALNPRQEKLLNLGDAFLSLPGGIGTIYEIVAVLALKRKGEVPEGKPLILIDDYFIPFGQVMEKMRAEGFLNHNFGQYFQYVKNPEEAIKVLKSFFLRF